MEHESMTPGYFESMYQLFFEMEHTRCADQGRVQLLQLDVKILKAFCLCLETWNYSVDEENMERWRSVITPFKVIWPKDFIPLLLERCEGRPMDMCIQDFNSVMFELEAKFLQSKHEFQSWYQFSMMQCKSLELRQIIPTFITEILTEIKWNLRARSPDTAVDILIGKIYCLEGIFFSIKECKESLRFMNFIGNFANKVTCLTCWCWAVDFECEVEIVIFDMLQEMIPYAFDIIPLYIDFLKSNNLHPVFDSFHLAGAVKIFDFFFDHLAIVLKDDFLILRDRLMFLFTFLTNRHCENAEGGDSIRSQIKAILDQDKYLLLPFDEMKEDFFDKKALLSAFMIRIDFRQLYRGSSDSWITLEVEKMEYRYFVSLHRELSLMEEQETSADREQLQLYRMELRFLRVFVLWLATWDDTDEEIKVKLSSVITSFQGIWGEKEEKGLLAHRFHAIRTGSNTDWHPLAFELQEKIEQSKLETGAWCVNFFRSSFQFKTSTSYMILEFLDSILESLNDLSGYKASENIVPFKKQIETLEEKLMFLKENFKLAVNCTCYEKLEEFKMFVQAFANDAACLTLIYWEIDANAKSPYETNCILSHMLQKIKPDTPDVARLYFGTLMAIYEQRSDSLMFGRTAFSFVVLFLEDLAIHLKDDDIHILQDNIVFLLTFLNDPSNQNAEELIGSIIDVLFWEGLYGLTPFDDTEQGFSKKKVLLSDFMMKIEAINAKIRCIYGKFPDSSLYNFPKLVSPLFLDFLLQKLRNLKDRMNSDRKYVPFAICKIIKIEEELTSLCPFFNQLFDLQSELKESWLEVVNVLHLAEHVIMSCVSSLFIFDHPFWYHMAYLSNVLDEITVVKAKLEMIGVMSSKSLPKSFGFISELEEQGRPSEINETIVGFEDEREKIINMLTWGSKSLEIVSVVGMAGLGKTTLAKKVFSSSLGWFDVFAFCSVSLDCNSRRLLLDIIRDIQGDGDIRRGMTKDDLAHHLWKCLNGQKYLIVLDDIWNISAWDEVKSSFPNDDNGSRVMFTTRSHEVAKKYAINCSPHQLRFLNEVESWELLQEKVFRNEISPPYLYEVGRQIAKNCKGLPLAVVVIGGLLARTEKSLTWWSEVEQQLAFYLYDEGCMESLELGYKHLPKNLKPCLIYLGAYPEDSLISVKHVIRLWIAEGFIQESMTKSLDDVAQEYFYDLVERSFVIVGARSHSGGIKTFRIHDLVLELCRTKCRDGSFFQLNHGSASYSSSELSINNHYRVSTRNTSDFTNAAESSLSNVRTLHIFANYVSHVDCKFPLRKFRLLHVLDTVSLEWEENDFYEVSSLIHLRYIDVNVETIQDFLPRMSNLWNLTSLRLKTNTELMQFPETFWTWKNLRHVKVESFSVNFPDDDKHEACLSSDQILDNVVSFSRLVFYSGKDVKRLLQRLPVVRKMRCVIHIYIPDENNEESIETLDFDGELESLNIEILVMPTQFMINFPSKLKTLSFDLFRITPTTLSAIAELHCLEVLKLSCVYFVEERLETEDLVFQNLRFFQLIGKYLTEWKTTTESFPCLEQLEIECEQLKELPPCFGELPTLKKIGVKLSSEEAVNSALRIQEELLELGMQLEVLRWF